jgi:hypothetical protein
MSGIHSTATSRACGSNSRSNSSRLPCSSSSTADMPVRLPPGRANDGTRPLVTGSLTPENTIGIVLVARFAAIAATVVRQKNRSTPSATSATACASNASGLPPVCRQSIT